ncbi:hypothetical protein DFH06DRAFT_449108 [Mycena polygramma]|nr:hypothetical protein DFH06DRAFT_449108 [Mycena polygramma]
MFAVAFVFLAVSASALAAMPSLPVTSSVDLPAPIDIKIAAATAAYAVPANATGGSGSHNNTDYVDLFDIRSVHVGRYAAADFLAAASAVGQRTNCDALSPEQVKTLRGWPSLLAAIGGDYRGILEGPRFIWTVSGASTQIGFSCAGEGPYNITGELKCTEQQLAVMGNSTGSTGVVTASYTAGIASSLTLTTTKSSTLSVGVTVSVGVKCDIFEAGASTTVTTSVTNEDSKVIQDTLSVQSTLAVQMTPTGPNSHCELKFNTTSCTSTGVVKVPFVATGWILTGRCTNGYNGGYCYPEFGDVYFNIDANLPDPKLRQSVMELQGATKGQMSGTYTTNCT